jgi:hypothetical protein
MAKKYVSRVRVMRNGNRIQDMKQFKSDTIEYRAEVDTMDGSGTVEKNKKVKFSLDYAIPKVNAKLDWSDVVDETWTIELEGGRRVTYTGVDILSKGETTYDSQKEAVFTLSFIAESEVIQ